MFAGHGGDGFLSANDDVMPTASEEPWDVVAGVDANVINGFETICLHTSTVMIQVLT